MVVAAVQPRPGYSVSAAGKENKCPQGTYNTAAAGQKNCVSCPAGFTTLAEGTATAACFVRPGWQLDAKSKQPRPCDKGSWSPGGSPKDPSGSCIKCAAGFTTQTDESTKATDCEVCLEGRGGPSCALCPSGSFSADGGKRSPCSACQPGQTSPRGATNPAQCFAAMMPADQDYFPLSEDKLWKGVAAQSAEACAAACAANTGEGSGPPACIMYRWSDAAGCQQLQEQQPLPDSSLLGFKVLQGTDYAIYRVPASTTAGEQVGSQEAKTLQECVAACDALNTCEVFSFPGFKAAGACRMFSSVLESEYQSMVHVSGAHLFYGRTRARLEG
ncbi:hypothetical protein OEZ86_009753 [Tetradesmus obliquus]|uniref:TNFR-Cys domain-containing protein n=1 Tax=Tetradesmus obliquus TaxID=3088 RepID=A0ABY8UR79_TETOB|nr:hypothetical protein OEZ85_001196 [Tetradesmus obliquus]WIA43248.1 hypothetical protein OEZ86_009753 [Tetradesmus obliquus]